MLCPNNHNLLKLIKKIPILQNIIRKALKKNVQGTKNCSKNTCYQKTHNELNKMKNIYRHEPVHSSRQRPGQKLIQKPRKKQKERKMLKQKSR